MTKKHLDITEWYPVFVLDNEDGYNDTIYLPQDFSEDELTDYERVRSEFKNWQNKLKQRFGVK